MSEAEELNLRCRHLVKTMGYDQDIAGDKTHLAERVVARAWIENSLYMCVSGRNGFLQVRYWSMSYWAFEAAENNRIWDKPLRPVAKEILLYLRTRRLLEDIADV